VYRNLKVSFFVINFIGIVPRKCIAFLTSMDLNIYASGVLKVI